MAEMDRGSGQYGLPPWSADGREVCDRVRSEVAAATNESNARRIVACVNACGNIPTEELERGVLAELVFYCGSVKDEKLAAIIQRLGKLKLDLE